MATIPDPQSWVAKTRIKSVIEKKKKRVKYDAVDVLLFMILF